MRSREDFDEATIALSCGLAEELKSQCIAFDLVYQDGNPLVAEISYGVSPEVCDPCPGHWAKDMTRHAGSFDPYNWMVHMVISEPRKL